MSDPKAPDPPNATTPPKVALPDHATRAVDAVDALLKDWPLTAEPRRQLAARIVGAVDALMHGAANGTLANADVAMFPSATLGGTLGGTAKWYPGHVVFYDEGKIVDGPEARKAVKSSSTPIDVAWGPPRLRETVTA